MSTRKMLIKHIGRYNIFVTVQSFIVLSNPFDKLQIDRDKASSYWKKIIVILKVVVNQYKAEIPD